MKKLIVKNSEINVLKELDKIGFDSAYINNARDKYEGKAYKVFNLKPYEANILKQLCLSLGFDCAVSRDTVKCSCEYTDGLIFATHSQLKKLIEKLKFQPFRLNKLADELNNALLGQKSVLNIRNYKFDWTRQYIAGILNLTPNSFSDGGMYNSESAALKHTVQMINDGADIIDIGGESTRPNAQAVSVSEEINRVIPIIKLIRDEGIDIPISVDTRNYETAKAAVENGADIINDVSGFNYDEKLFYYVCENNIPSVVMHSDKVPANSENFTESDIVEQIYFYLYNKISKMNECGLDIANIIVDVGIGFGKSQEANFEILNRINEFTSLNVPMLIGISRKSFIQKEFNISPSEADEATALYSSMLKAVDIHRVHNVKLAKKYINYSSKLFF